MQLYEIYINKRIYAIYITFINKTIYKLLIFNRFLNFKKNVIGMRKIEDLFF